jgi:hypothetical protein
MLKNILVHSMAEMLNTFTNPKQNLLLLVGENSDFTHSLLSKMQGEVCGAIFPQVIHNENHYDNAIIVVDLGIKAKVTISLFNDFKKGKVDAKADDIIVFVDGLSNGITNFLEDLYESTSLHTNIIGAGAGKLSFKQERVLFTKDTFIQDGVLLITDTWHISTSAKHGWKKLKGPYIASCVKDTTLNSLDYNDAFDVYKEVVEKDSAVLFDENNFFNIAKSYPLGILKLASEVLVRDPIALKDKSLILVGDIEDKSLVYILKGDKEELIYSARLSAKEALCQKNKLSGVMVFDCISRVLFLDERFDEELKVIKHVVNTNMFGAISIGEISNTNHDYIDFYNKTCVIGAF